jgi:hypothetical protein
MASIKEQMAKGKALWAETPWEEIATFIGPNAEYYRAHYEKIHTSMAERGSPGFMFSWHWPALIPLLGIPWAAARKNWAYVGMMALFYVVIIILGAFMERPNFGFAIFLAPAMAKQTYFQFAMTKIGKIRATTAEGPARDAALRDAGGLDMRLGNVAGAICAAIVVLNIVLLVILD